MQDKIVFNDLRKSLGRIDFHCSYCKDEKKFSEDIFFEMSEKFIASNEVIAVALLTLCGQSFKEIEFDFPIKDDTVKYIKSFTKATINSNQLKSTQINSNQGKESIILNFSGGLDSLAALYLMPKDTKLVSIDFGGYFTKEEQFFKTFNPYTVKTNFRQLKLDRFSWTFMGVGAILYSEYLNAKYNVFGTILEASNFAFRKKLTIHNAINTMPFSGLGLMDIRLMNGLTEVGTAIIATYYGSDIVEQSLESLATNGSEKKKRKELLLKIVCNKFNRDIKIPESLEPKNKIKFGTNLALDFLCLYILKNMGIDAVHKTMSELPEEIIKFAENHELSFYERLHSDFICGISFPDNDFRSEYMSKLITAGVLPYSENDFIEFRKVANLLNKYHKFDTN